MESVVIDGVRYVPEHPETQIEQMQHNGVKVTAKKIAAYIEVHVDGKEILSIGVNGNVFIFNAEQWAKLDVRGNAGTATRRTIEAIAKQVGLNTTDDNAEITTLHKRIEELENQLPLKDFSDVEEGDKLLCLDTYSDALGSHFTAGNTYIVKETHIGAEKRGIGVDSDNLVADTRDTYLGPATDAPHFTKTQQ